MKILCLYNNPCAEELFAYLRGEGNEIVLWSGQLDAAWCEEHKFDLAVSYTYRYLLTEEIFEALRCPAVNLHNSILPYNRGADPNLWSLLDGTPRGVTLHFMDARLDKGDIIAQRFVRDGERETLRSSYDNLDRTAKELFREAFQFYPYWEGMRKKALGAGNYHSKKDGDALRERISSYEISVEAFRECCKDLIQKERTTL